MVRCVTYNVFLGGRLNPLLDWLCKSVDPLDIYCFQEYPTARLKDITKWFDPEKYEAIYAPCFYWKNDEYGELTIFNKQKLKLVKNKTISLGGKNELQLIFVREKHRAIFKINRTKIERSAILTKFSKEGKKFTLINAHLFADVHNKRKMNQLKLILDKIKSESNAVLLGDFNYPYGSGLPKLMSANNFESALNNLATYKFIPGVYWQNDYIFFKDLDLRNVGLQKVKHSDHFPIFFEIYV